MMSSSPEQRESARQRALRIRLEYVHHRDSLARGKLLLTLLAAVVTVIYCGWAMFFQPAGPAQFAPHDVSSAHAHFERDCQACHVNFVPLRADASLWPARLLGAAPAIDLAVPERSPAHGIIAKRCQTCHVAASHHRLERPADVAACSTCHREHLGSAANLRQVANNQCTNCHAEITLHRAGRSSVQPDMQNVGGFGRGAEPPRMEHPEFRSLQSDPGTIKFQHHLHLLPGLPAKDAAGRAGRPLKTLADLPADVVARYRRPDQRAGDKPEHEYLVQLDCSSCHRTEDAAAANGQSGPPDSGAYYRPIDFARDCQSCHPLPFDAARPDARLPHGLTASAISDYLRRFYAADGLKKSSTNSTTDKPDASGQPWRPQRLVPGHVGDPQARAEVERTVAQQVTLAQDYLQRQAVCTKCHDEQKPKSTGPSAGELSPQVAPAAIPAVWLRHSRFSHVPHQTLLCGECHAAAEPPPAASNREGNPSSRAASAPVPPLPDRDLVMIAGRDTCLRCHAESSGSPGPTLSVRTDCVLCHRYHGADHSTRPGATPLGTPSSPAGPRRTIADWLAPSTGPKR